MNDVDNGARRQTLANEKRPAQQVISTLDIHRSIPLALGGFESKKGSTLARR
jgi:hypothetical protein